jgi:hypothetical protein
MRTTSRRGIMAMVLLTVLVGLLPAAHLARSAEESPASAAACSGTGTATLTGHVTDSTGAAIPGVTMKLAGPSSCTNTTTTNSSGAYAFRKLGAGNYTVTASKTNCTFQQKGRTKVIAGKLLILNFTGTCK